MMFVIDPTAINKQSQTEQSYPKLGDFPSSIKKTNYMKSCMFPRLSLNSFLICPNMKTSPMLHSLRVQYIITHCLRCCLLILFFSEQTQLVQLTAHRNPIQL